MAGAGQTGLVSEVAATAAYYSWDRSTLRHARFTDKSHSSPDRLCYHTFLYGMAATIEEVTK